MSRNQDRVKQGDFKMTWVRVVTLTMKTATAALVLGLLATCGYAQTAYQGKFTLAVETRWGSATLPAGDYTFTLQSNSAPYRLYIQGQEVSAIIQATTAELTVASKRAQLNLVDIADVYTIETFEAPDLGVTFTYWTPPQKHIASKEAHQKTVSQTAPATQASENKTSIEVHTVGR
jgi:hypothetical protein